MLLFIFLLYIMYQESISIPILSRMIDCQTVNKHKEPNYSQYIFAMSPNERFATFQVVDGMASDNRTLASRLHVKISHSPLKP